MWGGFCGVSKDVKEVRVSAVQRKLSLEKNKKKAFEDTVVLVASRHSDCIWLVHVIFPHVQMTCQLLLNYMRHLDQRAQCQHWLILFIVAVMTVPVDTERAPQNTTTRDYRMDFEKAAGDRIGRARVDWLNDCPDSSSCSWFPPLMIGYCEKEMWWETILFPESGNSLRHNSIWLEKTKHAKKSWCCLLPRKSQHYCSAQCAICLHTFSRWWMAAKSFEYHVQLKSWFYTHQDQLLSVIFTSASCYFFQFNIC